MYPHSFLWHYLWIAPHALQIAIAMIMLRRGLHRLFPWFFIYTVFQVVLNAVLFILDHDASVTAYQYRWVEWVGDVPSIVLRFAVIQEIFTAVVHSYPALKRLGTLMFRCAVVGLVLLAVAAAVYSHGTDFSPHIQVGLMLLDRAAAIVQCGLLLFLFLFSSYFQLSWRSFIFGIAVGLGIFSAVQLAMAAIGAQIGTENRLLFDFLPMATYHFCVLIWLFYLLAPEPVQAAVPSPPAHDLESWTHELQRLLQR